MEMQFYMKECIKEGWKVRELKRQINSSLFQRLALSTDKEGVLALANEGTKYSRQQISYAILIYWNKLKQWFDGIMRLADGC